VFLLQGLLSTVHDANDWNFCVAYHKFLYCNR